MFNIHSKRHSSDVLSHGEIINRRHFLLRSHIHRSARRACCAIQNNMVKLRYRQRKFTYPLVATCEKKNTHTHKHAHTSYRLTPSNLFPTLFANATTNQTIKNRHTPNRQKSYNFRMRCLSIHFNPITLDTIAGI